MTDRNSFLLAAVIALAGLLILGAGVAPVVSADDEPDDPQVPASFYGTVTVDGEPAEPGVVIVAAVEGDDQDSIVVEEAGTFGGPAVDDEKLTVQGYEGDEISFYVEGEGLERTQADQTVELEAFDDQSIDLTVSTGHVGGNGGTSDDPATPIPVIDVAPGTTVTVGETVTFSASESSVATGSLVGFEWTIDGENRSINESFTETFVTEGEFEIELLVRSDENQTANTSVIVSVQGADDTAPVADDETDADTDTDDDALPGFGIVAALLAVAYGLYRLPQPKT